ncbi:MAG: penicillin-insensitive murein endopeptidase [Geminicoccaceae bacterium]
MPTLHRVLLAVLLGCCCAVPALAATPAGTIEPPAKELFGAATLPSPAPATEAIGSYAKGCLAGGVALPENGPGWQVMRLARNRAWGHPALIAAIGEIARAAQAEGWPGILVGDMAQPRGGPMRTGHASHQIGLDVDIWLTPMPDRLLTGAEREQLSAISMLKEGTRTADPARLTAAHRALIRDAARLPEVERIFVHPGIKQALCAQAGGDRAWLAKVRPWYGHDAHFHVRLACPPGEPACQVQEPPPAGDGCGAELAWWLGEEPWRPSTTPPAPPLRLADLPAQCAAVLRAP